MPQEAIPSAAELEQRLSPRGRHLSPVTLAIAALEPGQVFPVTGPGLTFLQLRRRAWNSARSARRLTGHRYRVITMDGRLFVFRGRPDETVRKGA